MKLRYLVLLLAVATGTAQAAFYVDEDAPQDTAAQLANIDPPKVYDVPFYAQRSQLGPLGHRTLTSLLLDAHRADHITITGYGDTLGAATLGRQRATTIHRWLVDNGVLSSKITVAANNAVRSTDTPNVFNSTVTFSSRAARPVVSPDRRQTATLVRDVKSPPPAVLAAASPAPLADERVKLAIAAKLVAMGKNNIISPEDAVALLAEFLGNTNMIPPTSPQPAAAPALAVTQQAPAPSLPQPLPAGDLPRTWTLSNTKTLQDNITEWAATAGWEKPIWESSNPYQVTFSSTMSGTFLEVLGQIARAVPELDFHIWKNRRVFRVADRKRQP